MGGSVHTNVVANIPGFALNTGLLMNLVRESSFRLKYTATIVLECTQNTERRANGALLLATAGVS